MFKCPISKIPPLEKIIDLIWLQTGFLGDIVLTTASFMALTKVAAEFGVQVRQHLITTRQGAEILQGERALSSITIFEKRGKNIFSAFQEVKRSIFTVNPPLTTRSTVLLQPHRSFRSSLLAHYLGFPTVTYSETALSRLATIKIDRLAVFHEAQRIALLLEPLGIERRIILENALSYLEPVPLKSEFSFLKDFRGKLVGIAPGSVWATKKWTTSGFVTLVKKLLASPHIGIVLLGGKNETADADNILAEIPEKSRLWNLVGQTSLSDLKGIFPLLSLLISNDSSPVHFASAYKVSTVAIFGATIPEMGFGPLAPGSTICGIDLPCRPCSDHGPQKCPLGHFRCMKDLEAEDVYQKCRNILQLGLNARN